jgi:uncharacterized protein YacL
MPGEMLTRRLGRELFDHNGKEGIAQKLQEVKWMTTKLRLLLIVTGGWLGYQLSLLSNGTLFGFAERLFGSYQLKSEPWWFIGVGAVLVPAVGAIIRNHVEMWLKRWELWVRELSVSGMVIGLIGLFAGLLIAVTASIAMQEYARSGFWLILTAAMCMIGYRIGTIKKKQFSELFLGLRTADNASAEQPVPMNEHKILDTSVIIDGRIADICKTGFLDGTMVIPEFVLEELQHIADSSDLLKRNRGRRGLDILNKIQKELDVKVLIYEGDFDDITEVDSKLVRLAKVLKGKVVTNDYNLNKVCELQGVSVLNINDLANAVKPIVLPGEEIHVQVIKDGKEHGQGVAYLDDGTMIVVEGGRDYIGMNIEVLVTSVLQTSAGRMIFAKPKLLEKAL